MKTYGIVEIYFHEFLILAQDAGDWSTPHPSHFISRERVPSTHWIGGRVSPRAGLGMVARSKIPSLPLPGIKARSSSP